MIRRSGRVKTPTVLQIEAVECGAASLAILLGYYRKWVGLPELRAACGVSRDGSKAGNLVRAARTYGFEAKGFKRPSAELAATAAPYIVFWNNNHFLVVEGLTAERAWLNDPAYGPRVVSRAEFDQAYSGIVITLLPGAEFKPSGKPPRPWPAIAERLGGNAGAIAYCLAAGALLILPEIAVVACAQVFIENVMVRGMVQWLQPLIWIMAVSAIATLALELLQRGLLRRLEAKLAIGGAGKFLAHALRLPLSFYAQRFAGEIGQRGVASGPIARSITRDLLLAAIDAGAAVALALAMAAYDGMLAVLALSLAAVNFFALRWISRARVDAHMRMGIENGQAAGVSIAGLQSIETIKASGLESDFFARWAGFAAKATNTRAALANQEQLLDSLPPFLLTLTTVMVFVLGGARVMIGVTSIGKLFAFQLLLQALVLRISRLVNLGASFSRLEADLARQDDLFRDARDPEARESASDETLPDGRVRLSGEVAITQLSFGYSRLAPPLISQFDLTLAPGSRVALVGSSGSGKSTLAKLVTGLYAPWEGEIRFDGLRREQVPRPILADSIAMVEQDLFLFEGSVRENLTLWDATIDERDLIDACVDADIHGVILALPGGYDGQLLEGASNLSGGQRQRLELARALAKRPTVLVMDEATSALDAESERQIMRNIARRGCTCLIVAHRLSTVRDCDEIVVFERGRVVERGTHETLLAANGVYAGLVAREASQAVRP